jgi:hypothetical protein
MQRSWLFQGWQDPAGTDHQVRCYLPTLLILGAKSALQAALRKPPELRHHLQRWIVDTLERIRYRKTLVAIANKHARIIWALLVKGEEFAVRRVIPQAVAVV